MKFPEKLQKEFINYVRKLETASGGASKKGSPTASSRKRISKTVGHVVTQRGKDPAGKKDKGVHISLTDESSKDSYKDEDFEDY